MVEAYRLIGYENRILNQEDFEDDKKDAGEIGSGQTITALYEIKPKYNPDFKRVSTFEIDFRYKNPNEDISNLLKLAVKDMGSTFDEASEDLRFAASVASFGMLLRDSEYKGDVNYQKVLNWTNNAKNFDPYNYKDEFIQLIQMVQ